MNQYNGTLSTFRNYWRIYGGLYALLKSPYLHTSFLIAIIIYPIWSSDCEKFYNLVFTIVPSVLGFSLGGYAILLAFGDDEFRKRISGKDPDGKESPFLEVNATFIHFILVSAISLPISLIGLAWKINSVFAFIPCLLLIYSIACALASAFAIFHVAGWYDEHSRISRENESNQITQKDNGKRKTTPRTSLQARRFSGGAGNVRKYRRVTGYSRS